MPCDAVNEFVKDFTENQNGVLEHRHEDDYQDILEHYGVGGQKWGVRHGPPYPLEKDSKKRLKKVKKEVDKARKKEEAEKRKEEKAKADYERKKNQYSKTAKTLYKHRDMYTKEEIKNILERFEWEDRIKNYAASDLRRAKDKVNTFKDFSSSIVTIAENALKGYNIVAKVHNVADKDAKKWELVPIGKENKEDKGDKK